MSEDDDMEEGVAPAASPVNGEAAEGRGRGFRIVLAVNIVLGLLILIAFGALVVGLFRKIGGHGAGSAPQAIAQPVLPPDATIKSMDVSGNRLILRVQTRSGEEVDIVDTADGHLIARIGTAAPEIPR